MSINENFIVSRIDQPSTLKERFDEWGYLYIQQYVSAEKCDALMHAFLNELEPHLRLNTETSLPELSGEPFFETDPIWDDVYPRMQALEVFHQFFHDDEILQLMRVVAGDKVFVYPMTMARIGTPKKLGYETPPHQDAHSHGAGPTMAGMWVALHDVSEGMGRLKMLPKSHKRGVRPVFEAQGVGGVQCEIYDDEATWHVSNVKKGDVIIFNSCTVHKAEPNILRSASRLSVDTRFCDYGAPVWKANLEPHHGWRIDGLNWDSIYSHWENDALKYYWKDYPNTY
ncbi:phytanoyl-CoA dioxygenase [Halieaceae bacterium IMCC14734]|uniref:Phytanoyl-CoA dioxygenase n=1 Tax=Candidatus Litorirhabdus singularis TaxID=2518993 RepID=A0ABT3TLV0_9GAMM|nr:phytanoyl-CoA dioxygenase family protein [Candidatus Litorirhabdus singularis]MCX2983308.1 phytanoyl-CoA dioxygenase [Candidatus Litorirhabdus singularis]